MKVSNTKIDQLIQFILAAAGQEDFDNRELGNIHIIKYMYIADLEYAKHYEGKTYTTLPWIFYHFGPYCNEAFLRIEPALTSIGASKKIIQSHKENYDGEFVRWSLVNEEQYYRLEKNIPIFITGCIHKNVHKFSANTEDLLDFVYKTIPMLRAKPNELLDFSIPDYINEKNEVVSTINSGHLSIKQQKKRSYGIENLKKEFMKRLEEKKRKMKSVVVCTPIYDDIYYEGLKTLDSLAGQGLDSLQGVVRFSDDLWKSKARFDPDVS